MNLAPFVEIQFTGMFDSLSAELFSTAKRIGSEALDHFDAGMKGTRGKAVEAFFDRINREADERAQKVADAAADRLKQGAQASLALADPSKKADKKMSFLQAKAERIAFGGDRSEKKLKIVGDPVHTQLLDGILRAVQAIGKTAVV
jgi:hypothetical protein